MCAGAGCVVDLGRWLTTFGQEGVPGRPVGSVPLGFLVVRRWGWVVRSVLVWVAEGGGVECFPGLLPGPSVG